MNDLLVLAPLGLILLAALFYLERLERSRAMRLWRWGYVALFGGSVMVVPNTPLSWAVVSFTSAAFVSLMFAGAQSFAGRPIPGWLLPGTIGLGALRAGFTLAGSPGPMSAVAIAVALVLFAWGSYSLWQSADAKRAGVAERLLGPVLAIFGLLHAAAMALRFFDVRGGGVFVAMIGGASSVGLLQLLAGLERTRRRETESKQALEQERRTLRAVLETAPLDIVLRDDEGRIRMINRRAAEHLGLTLDAAGEPLPEQELPSDVVRSATAAPAIGRTIARDREAVIQHQEMRIGSRPDQTFEIFSSPVRSDSGESLGRLWMIGDVTRERRLQQQLFQSQKMETLGTLAGGVAHDFNNQLTTILGNARLASEDLHEDQDEIRQSLEDLERAAEHCSALTHGLLAFARRTPRAAEPLAIEPLLDEIESLLRATLPSRIHLEIVPEDALWEPLADPTQIKQVLLNLAINARDAIEGSGSIEIRVRNLDVDTPRIVASGETAPGRFIEFTVTDTGHGIEPACQERIFDPFFTTKPTGEGTGLGLAIVYGVVSSHGGWLDVDSQPGRTALRFVLPAAEGTARDAEVALPPLVPVDGETVLLVDDEPALRRLVRTQLEALGYEVVEAESGEHAIALGKDADTRIDVAVVDLAMPGIDGLETLAALGDERPGLPGLLISGYLDGTAEGRTGGVEVLLKPFEQEALGRAIQRAFARTAAADQRAIWSTSRS